MEENEKKKKSRGWVKDAAIIFLAVLLVLTFFSNTILNRSLPEVATVLVQEGTITNKVRGTGTVSARENYDVTIEQTRQVQSVLVRVGDEVKAGDVLFTLQPGDSDELEQAQKQLKQMEKDLRSLENEYQIWLLGLTEADDYEQDQAVSDAREALQDARTAQAEAAITEEDLAEYEAEIASLEAEIRECEEEIAAQKVLIEEKKAAVDEKQAVVDEKQAVVDEKQAVVDEKQADVDAFNDGDLREMELRRRELQDEKEAKELIVREKQAVVDEKQALVAEKQSVVDAAQQKVNEAISTRSQYSSMDPSYASVSSAELQVQQAQAEVDAAEEALAVAKVVNGAQYDLLVQEANLLGYQNEVYRLEKDAEPRYRRINGLGSEALTTEQQTEVAAMLEADIDALGDPAAYVTQDQNIYLAAAAEKTAYSERRDAYNAITRAESSLDSAKSRLAQSNNTYSNALSDYLNNSGNSSNYYKYDREVDKAQAELDKAKEPLSYAKDVLAAAEKDRDQAKAEVSLVDQALTDLENSKRRLQQEELADLEAIRDAANKELTTANNELTTAKNDLDKAKNEVTTEENKLTEMEGDRGDKKLAEQKIENLEKELKGKEDAYKSAGQNVRDKERALDRAMRNLENTKKSDSAQALRNSVDRQNKQDAIEEKRQDIADQEVKIEELLGTDSGTEVKSNVAGKVQSLSVSAGHKAEAGKTLAVIEVPDLGYSMNFSVTNEQARRLKVGDSATVSNFYWGSQIVATLTSIQTDPQNPQGSKLLTFDVTGDVTVGNSLTISIGERNANYDMVVPNSAVRSDTNGSFVLMITAKNSPLGNRYFASRVNVEVVASDDQYSAISGAIEAYDSVITTASRNAPISSGDQVRLADSN